MASLVPAFRVFNDSESLGVDARPRPGMTKVERGRCLMLSRLSIRDIVLIDRLDIDFAEGLAVLTGETGAGKSILLDAFALALGARGDQTLVRQGVEQGQVSAVFEVARNHPARAILERPTTSRPRTT